MLVSSSGIEGLSANSGVSETLIVEPSEGITLRPWRHAERYSFIQCRTPLVLRLLGKRWGKGDGVKRMDGHCCSVIDRFSGV